MSGAPALERWRGRAYEKVREYILLCAYLDESGNSGNASDPAQTHHYVGALITHESAWLPLKREMESIAHDVSGHGVLSGSFEFHGVELYQGMGRWRGVPMNERLAFYGKCVDLIVKYELSLIVGCCDKTRMSEYGLTIHPHSLAFLLCMERVAKYASERNSLVMLVADDSSQSVRDATREVLATYRSCGPPFGTAVDLECVIDTVHFLNSGESRHIQLCDLALYALQRWELKRTLAIETIAKSVLSRIADRKTMPYDKTPASTAGKETANEDT